MKIRARIRQWSSPILLFSLFVLPAIAFAATDNATLTVGHMSTRVTDILTLVRSGYAADLAFGSYSPTGLSGGKTVFHLYDVGIIPTTDVASLKVSGFSSDPGQSWTASVTCNGITKTGVSATYSYTSGSATWSWSTNFGLRSKPTGTNVNCAIVHN